MPDCPRCLADPYPYSHSDAARRCAFTTSWFLADNWGCASLQALVEAVDPGYTNVIYGADESLNLIACDPDDERGWIVLTRYKSRGSVSSAVHVGDHEPLPVSLALVDATLAYYARRSNATSS